MFTAVIVSKMWIPVKMCYCRFSFAVGSWHVMISSIRSPFFRRSLCQWDRVRASPCFVDKSKKEIQNPSRAGLLFAPWSEKGETSNSEAQYNTSEEGVFTTKLE